MRNLKEATSVYFVALL